VHQHSPLLQQPERAYRYQETPRQMADDIARVAAAEGDSSGVQTSSQSAFMLHECFLVVWFSLRRNYQQLKS
jgi:hypothetical protein